MLLIAGFSDSCLYHSIYDNGFTAKVDLFTKKSTYIIPFWSSHAQSDAIA